MFTTAAFKLTAKASLNAVSVKNRSREENGKISQNCTENCRFRLWLQYCEICFISEASFMHQPLLLQSRNM